VTLHSYRYAWAERAKTAGYPERFAQLALGHNSKAVHRAYPHTQAEELLVSDLAAANDLPVYTGRVKTPEFGRMFVEEWKPDLCLMATFGQKIPKHIFQVPRLGFYNFHHSDEVWPSYPGPDPVAGMGRDGKTHIVITMHEVTEVLDGRVMFARSHKVALPPDANAVKVHRTTWPQMGGFIRQQVKRVIQNGVPH
jgi:methionyl-tRNA formyltransferase